MADILHPEFPDADKHRMDGVKFALVELLVDELVTRARDQDITLAEVKRALTESDLVAEVELHWNLTDRDRPEEVEPELWGARATTP
jgi:hypothetical protein